MSIKLRHTEYISPLVYSKHQDEPIRFGVEEPYTVELDDETKDQKAVIKELLSFDAVEQVDAPCDPSSANPTPDPV